MEKPIIVHENTIKEKELRPHLESLGVTSFVDALLGETREIALLDSPEQLFTPGFGKTEAQYGEYVWVIYPWKKTAVRIPDQKSYSRLRLSRNANLITPEEQEQLQNATIAIAGLNVGNPGAMCMVHEGIGKKFRLSDNDVLSIANLNRFRASITELGMNKAILTAQQAWEVNPFLEVAVVPKGLNEKNIDMFLEGADILVEEMDHLVLKIAIRKRAKEKHIPVVMVTGNGAGVILDVERHDTESDLPILNGHLSEHLQREIHSPILHPTRRLGLAQEFMGSEWLTERLNTSFSEVGKSLIGIPQLAEASFLRGATLAFAVRSILLGNELLSGRYAFQLADVLKETLAAS